MSELIAEEPKTKKKKVYFGKEVQDAVIEFNSLHPSRETERARLFNQLIYPAFMKLAENIINTWKFHRYETNYSDLQREAVCELYTKISGYDPELGRAYSYFTIICRNFLIKKSKQLYESSKVKVELEVVDQERNVPTEVMISEYQELLSDFVYQWCDWCDANLARLFKSSRDQKVADAIIELFRSSKELDLYNKKLLYILIRERAGVETQHITKVVKVMRELFMSMFAEYQKYGFIQSSKYLL